MFFIKELIETVQYEMMKSCKNVFITKLLEFNLLQKLFLLYPLVATYATHMNDWKTFFFFSIFISFNKFHLIVCYVKKEKVLIITGLIYFDSYDFE